MAASKKPFCECSYLSEQMAMKGTSAGTSADLLLMVCTCVCVKTYKHQHMCVFLNGFMSLSRDHSDEANLRTLRAGGDGEGGDRMPKREWESD